MGIRYRKSINLGGGFRVNLSKSGVGYSFGTKGLRYTKTSKGRNRTTASIPGTGLSYVKETGGKRKNSNNKSQNVDIRINETNTYDTETISNVSANTLVSEGMEEMLSSAKNALIVNKISIWTIIVSIILSFYNPVWLIATVIGIILLIIVRKRGIISLEYTIDDYQLPIVEERLKPFKQITQSSCLWKIVESSKVKDVKYTSGASNTVKRTQIKHSLKTPFPFKTDVEVVTIKDKKETLVFLPDKLIVMQGAKVGALDYADIDMAFRKTTFVESEKVPKDATVISKTWKYVNKSGGPDKRFADNKQIPECSYGLVGLESNKGLNTIIMFSNPNVVDVLN